MSRIVVKNLPKSITSQKLEKIFASKGCITDLQLKYKNGVFRQFAFIGYKTESEAQDALEYFNDTYVHTSKIKVEICRNLFDKPEKSFPWKKNSLKPDDKTADKQINEGELKKQDQEKVTKELMKDPQFQEFLEVNVNRKSKPIWADGVTALQLEGDEDVFNSTEANQKKDEDVSPEGNMERALNKDDEQSPSKDNVVKVFDDRFTVKVRHLPYHCKKREIKDFFKPMKIISLRRPPKIKGVAYVKFKTEKDWKLALNKNKSFLGGNQVHIVKCINETENDLKSNASNQAENSKEENIELVAETGKIFVRNLCYSITEEEIEKVFNPFGPLAEIHVPIDLKTKKALGYAFVSFVFAEHAIKAFSELDGTIFQGRLLHLIPARAKKEDNQIHEEDVNFKKKKQLKLKEQSGSSHHWNILFLDTNALADIVASKYNIDKSKLLSGNSSESVAVRMALAETEIVMENRKFLINNGVKLDAFSRPATERSKTMIVVKNLPAYTTSEQLNNVFSKHGTISRVIVPPSGTVAIVEYDNPTEAKVAFKKLAYSRFKHLPLFLEWAPAGSVGEKIDEEATPDNIQVTNNLQTEKVLNNKKESEKEDNNNELPTNHTIFVKNINFCTNNASFEKHFEQCGPIQYASISTKIDSKTGRTLSMGFGFIQFKTREAAVYAMNNMQFSKLDGHALELKFAKRATISTLSVQKRSQIPKGQSAVILVRNIPFQADKSDIVSLFKQFGDLKSVRMPTKLGESRQHRGFGFVEYFTKDNAQRAFDALCHSTHLLSRHLILEWANPDPEHVDHLRKRTAQRFREGTSEKILKKSKLVADVALAAACYDQ